jgi:hypothetical protein
MSTIDQNFPRNIILSIDSDKKNYSSNYSTFYSYYSIAMKAGLSSEKAIEMATEAVKTLCDKRDERNKLKNAILSLDSDKSAYKANYVFYKKYYNQEIFDGKNEDEASKIALEKLEKNIDKRNLPTFVRPRDLSTYKPSQEYKGFNNQMMQEGNRIKRELKSDRKNSILNKISIGTGVNDEEELKKLWASFVDKLRNSNSESIAISRVIESYNQKKEVDQPKVYTEKELENYYKIVEILDPKNKKKNLEYFMKYLEHMSAELALERIKLLISARKYMLERGIAYNPLSIKIFLNSKGDFELAEKQYKERLEEGRLGLDVNLLSTKENNLLVNYNGEKINLSRLVSFLYDNENIRIKKLAYSQLVQYIFEFGLSVDEAVNRVNKLIRFIEYKPTLAKMFPEDSEAAITIFDGYYMQDNMSFDDALRATKEDLGNNPLN